MSELRFCMQFVYYSAIFIFVQLKTLCFARMPCCSLLAVVDIIGVLASLVLVDEILDNFSGLVEFLQSILEQRPLSVRLQECISFPQLVELVTRPLEQLLVNEK